MDNKYYTTDVEGLVKDLSSGAILNIDNEKLIAYKKHKKFVRNNEEMDQRLYKVENDLQEIKQLLREIAKK